jgi:hypothetical protein
VTSRRAQRGVRGWHIKTGPATKGRKPGRWGRRVATPGSLTGVAHLARLPHTICRKRMQVQILRAVPGRVLRIRIVLELEQDAAGHRRCRGEQGERVRREAARVDVQLCRLGVLVLDDGSGVRRLAPMAARYRELPPDRRAGRRTARQEDRPRRGRPPARRAIWHVLTPNRPFAPAGRPEFLAARRLSLRIGPRERSSHQPDPAAAGDGEISAAPTHDEGTTRPDHAGLDNRPLFMEKLFRFCARRGVGWWYWPCGHQPRPPESKDRRSATTRRRN